MRNRINKISVFFALLFFCGIFLSMGMVVASILDAPLVPGADNAYDIGLASPQRWRDAWFSGTLFWENSPGGTARLSIGTTTPHSSAILDIFSTTKGVLFPRMTTAERDAVSSPQAGLFIYNSSTAEFNRYDGSSWGTLGGVWTASGTDMYNVNSGNIGIGTTAPSQKLTLEGGSFLQTPGAPKVVGTISDTVNFGLPRAIAVSGRYAYVVNILDVAGIANFTVVDISNPASPQVVSSIDDEVNLYNAISLAVSGRYAYVVNASTNAGEAKFAVIDIANPTAPKVVGTIFDDSVTCDFLCWSTALAVSGRYAYVTNRVAGSGGPQFTVIDISDPTAPLIAGTLSSDESLTRNVGALALSGRYAYVANTNLYEGTANFAVIDIANPTAPEVVATLDDDTNLYVPIHMALSGRYAYVVSENDGADGKADFAVIDIANPTAPEVVATITDHTSLFAASGVIVAGRYAYVTVSDDASGRANFAVIDIANPTAPEVVATLDDDTNLLNAAALALSGHYAYVANYHGVLGQPQFVVLDISGVDAVSMNVGSLEAGEANIISTLQADSIHARTSMNIGIGGLYSQGPISIKGRNDNMRPVFSVLNASSTPLLYVQGDGKTGIGTAAPSSTLHIVTGYLQIEDNNAGVPPVGDCDADTERGRWSINTASSSVYFCTGTANGWQYFNLTD